MSYNRHPLFELLIRRHMRRTRAVGRWRPGSLSLGAICLSVIALAGCEMADDSGKAILEGVPAFIRGDSQAARGAAGEDPVLGEGVDIDQATAAAIGDAALAYVRRETAIEDIEVEIEAVAGDWARVRVMPEGSATDPATMYLRKEGASWRGVAIGTAFTPPDLDEMGVPAGARP